MLAFMNNKRNKRKFGAQNEINPEGTEMSPCGLLVLRSLLSFLFILSLTVLTSCTTREADDHNYEETIIFISMEDAMALVLEIGKDYYDDLTVTKVHSHDNDTKPSSSAGEDGTRQMWTIALGNEADDSVTAYIKNGVAINVLPFESISNNGLIPMNQLNMTAKEAVEAAKKTGLRGGNPDIVEEWVSGYNFDLEFGSLVKAPGVRRVFLTVIAISPDGNFARVTFDAQTKELVLSEEKIEYEDGSVIWQEF
jgi:hypothetical protein